MAWVNIPVHVIHSTYIVHVVCIHRLWSLVIYKHCNDNPNYMEIDVCFPTSVSELRDYSGCVLFDEYEVGLLVRDLTKIIALRVGEESLPHTTCSSPV